MFDEIDGEVIFHPYRTARVTDYFMVLPRSACEELESRLAKAAGVSQDNHVVYELHQRLWGDPMVVYLWFTDFKVYFGRGLGKGSY